MGSIHYVVHYRLGVEEPLGVLVVVVWLRSPDLEVHLVLGGQGLLLQVDGVSLVITGTHQSITCLNSVIDILNLN